MLGREDLANRFEYHPPVTEERRQAHQQIRQNCFALATRIDVLLPDGREKSLAITHLEEVMFWANGGLARSPDPAADEPTPASPEALTG
jgi:hypothetical protein